MSESVIIEDELPPAALEMYRRLMYLRDEYRRQTQAILGNSMDPGDKKNKKENDENDKRHLGKKVGSDDYQIRAITKAVIESHGGSSHLDTIVEYVHMRLPNLRKRDGSPFTAMDCKKHVQTNLRADITSSSPSFQKDPKQFGCWALIDDESNKASLEPLFSFLSSVIDASQSKSCKIKTLTEQTLKNWLPKVQAKGTDMTPDQTKEAIRIVLETNPRFKKDLDSYIHVPQKRRRIVGKDSTPSSKKRKVGSDSEDESTGLEKNSGHSSNPPRTPKTPKTSMFVVPPPGSMCKCGEKAPIKSSAGAVKWRKAANGTLSCPQCFSSSSSSGNGQTVEDTNPWIRCDDCHRWVRAKSDNIHDISLYDDSNPNHLDYYCPKCRKKREEAHKNPPSRHSKRTRRTSQNSSAAAASALPSSAPSTPTSEISPSTPKTESSKKNRSFEKRNKSRGSKAEEEEEEEEGEDIVTSSGRKSKRTSRSVSSSPRKESDEEEEEDGEIHSDESGPQSPEDGPYGGSNRSSTRKQNGETKRKNAKKEKKGREADIEMNEENEVEEIDGENEGEQEDVENEGEIESEKEGESSSEQNGSGEGSPNRQENASREPSPSNSNQ